MKDESVVESVPQFPGAQEGETLYAPRGLNAQLRITETAPSCWMALVVAELPSASFAMDCETTPYPTRAQAILHAAEDLIAWCAEQKQSGTDKHCRAAAKLQAWGFTLEKEHAVDSTALAGAADYDHYDEDAVGAAISAAFPAAAPIPMGEYVLYSGTTPAQMYPLVDLHPHPRNPRQVISDEKLEALAEDMRLHGFRQESPIYAQPREEGGALVLKGHRRLKAAQLAGLAYVPVVMIEVSERRALEMLNFDNYGGEQPHFLDAAEGWNAFLQQPGASVQEIATRANIGIEAVYKRLRCLKLIEPVRALCLSGRLTESHATLIAIETPEIQEAAAVYCTAPAWDPEREPPTRAELHAWLQQQRADAAARAAQTTIFEQRAAEPEAAAESEAPEEEEHDEEPRIDCTPKPAPPSDSEREADARLADQEREYRENRAAEEQRERDLREAEAQRVARENEITDKTFTRAMDAILENITWPLAQSDMQDILCQMLDSFQCVEELAAKFAVPEHDGATRQRDIVFASGRYNEQKLARMIFAGILLDSAAIEGQQHNALLQGMASRLKVNIEKIRRSVESEIHARENLRSLNPPAEGKTRKQAIAKLPALNGAKAKKAAAAPAPKRAKKAPAAKKTKGKK